MKKPIIIIMAIIILILLSILIVPEVVTSIKEDARQEGYNACVIITVNQIINDLTNMGYTELRLGNQTIKLGVIQ